MRVFVAVIVGTLGVIMLIAGVNGSGRQLFGTLFGKGTHAASTSASSSSSSSTSDTAGGVLRGSMNNIAARTSTNDARTGGRR